MKRQITKMRNAFHAAKKPKFQRVIHGKPFLDDGMGFYLSEVFSQKKDGRWYHSRDWYMEPEEFYRYQEKHLNGTYEYSPMLDTDERYRMDFRGIEKELIRISFLDYKHVDHEAGIKAIESFKDGDQIAIRINPDLLTTSDAPWDFYINKDQCENVKYHRKNGTTPTMK